MKHSQGFALAVFGVAALAAAAQAQQPGCYAQPATYYAAPATAYFAAPAVSSYAAAPYYSYYRPTYSDPYATRAVIYGPPGVPYRTSSYTGYYPAFYPPSYGTSYYRSAYGDTVVPSTSSYLPGAAYYTPSYSYSPGYNRVFLTTGDFHY